MNKKNFSKLRVVSSVVILALIFIIPLFLIEDKNHKDSLNYTETMYLEPKYDYTPMELGFTYLGEKEKFNDGTSNPVVLSFYRDFANWVTDTEVAWCSAFMNTIYASTGHEYTGTLLARDWLKVGEEVDDPRPGDIVVFWRVQPNSWQGHVAMYLNHTPDGEYISVLGGNQSNKVSVANYRASRLLGFRRPRVIEGFDNVAFMDSIPFIELNLKKVEENLEDN